ncbi:MAG: exo-beta-N-acetylmuramidase NamZ domain-containing protein [Parachlamydiaceae bacterium]
MHRPLEKWGFKTTIHHMPHHFKIKLIVCLFLFPLFLHSTGIQLGIDQLLTETHVHKLKNKRIGIVTNQTGFNSQLKPTFDLLKERAKEYKIVALFAPEHGFYGREYASDQVEHDKSEEGIPIFSLHGETRRPTEAMLKNIDLLIYDIQDIGSRSYTFISTLFYVMEEAAKKNIPVMVLDRPNPINGLVCDGPMLENGIRSIVGYINVPYCHGMTIGELATYFNEEYKVGCKLEVIPMKGWHRTMSYRDTGLPWIPTSPHIPEPDTPLYYPVTGILGELGIVSIGVGYTLPFKVTGSPWINAFEFSKALNNCRLSGVFFTPFFFRPFYGKFKGEDCQGVLITVTQPTRNKPVQIQFAIIYTLKK